MRVCVFGLWHLGSVTAACLAAAGHDVVGLDFGEQVVADLSAGKPPLFEPGLAELVAAGLASNRLRFTTDIAEAVSGAEVVWVAYDTPVDENDVADVAFVLQRVESLFESLADGSLVLISSQLPVGSARHLAARFAELAPGRTCHFAVSPENLRLGSAISVFTNPDRIIVGVRDDNARLVLEPLFASISPNLVWIGVESAEMTKHAINAFLATSITFANEVASICERVGADAREVARGLKTEARIGPKAYISPGAPFAGGTLARDISFLTEIGRQQGLDLPVLGAVRPSNDLHRGWVARALSNFVPNLNGTTVALLGLTYKPGTDTLRRSAAVELAEWLSSRGARVRGYDPALASLSDEVTAVISLCPRPEIAVAGANAVVLTTGAPALSSLNWPDLIKQMRNPVVIDPSGALASWAGEYPGLKYAAVGLTRGG